MDKMNITQHILFTCDANYTITNIVYSSGIFELVADYTTDMEDRSCNLTLTFDPNIIESTASKLSFTVKSRNSPLIITQYIEQY